MNDAASISATLDLARLIERPHPAPDGCAFDLRVGYCGPSAIVRLFYGELSEPQLYVHLCLN